MARPVSEIPWLEQRDNGKWYVNWYDAGRKRTMRLSLHTRDVGEAKARFASFLVDGGDIVRGKASLRLSVASAVEQYLKEHADVKCADPDRQHDIATHLVKFFGETAVADVDIPLSRAYANWRGAAPATVKRELGMLMAAANHAKKWKRLPPEQVPTVEYPAIPKTEVSFFTAEEVGELMRAANSRLRAFIVLAYFTAARRKSIERLEISQIKLDRRVIHLHKPGESETVKRKAIVPINDACIREIGWLVALSDTKYLFSKPTSFYRPFRKLCERLGYEGRSNPHLLRHSRATHLLQAGQDIFKVAGLLGDTMTTVQSTYGHHTPEHAASAVAPSDAGLLAALGNQTLG